MTNQEGKPGAPKDKVPPKPRGFSGFLLLAILFAIFIMLISLNMDSGVSNSPYLFEKHLFAGDFAKVSIEGDQVTATMKPQAETGEGEGAAGSQAGTFQITFLRLMPDMVDLFQHISALATDVNTTWAGSGGTELFVEDLKNGRVSVARAWVLQEDDGRTTVYFEGVNREGPVYGKILPRKEGALLSLEQAIKAKNTDTPITLRPISSKKDLFKVVEPNQLLPLLLTTIGPWVILIVLIYFFFFRQMKSGPGGGVLSFGKSRAMLYNKEHRTNITFADVAGIKEAKEEVSEIVNFLKDPGRFQRLGGRIPKGVLLVGSPGTGKTLLAKAIAGEAEVPFFSISGSDFVEMFVGVGASRVRDLFKQARDNSPCLIFLDEVDAVGRKRGSGLGGGHDEREQTLNAILVEMDGFGTDEGIILIAATNRPDVLDPALLRPGRFDRQITIDLPDLEGRHQILKVHARKVEMSDQVNLKVIAKATPSFSGADLAALINEAAILASVRDKDCVEMEDLEEARDRIKWGREKKSRALEREDRTITAYHEAGHALASILMPEVGALHKVTIIPRGMSLGSTMSLPERDDYHMHRGKVRNMLVHLLAGRAAEKICCEDICTGAESDIRRATHIARLMVAEWGMSDKVGPVSYTRTPEHNFLGRDFSFGKEHSEQVAYEIDTEVKGLLVEAMDRAVKMCDEHKDALERIKDALMEHETITGAEVKALMEGRELSSVPEAERWNHAAGDDDEEEEEEERTADPEKEKSPATPPPLPADEGPGPGAEAEGAPGDGDADR